MKKLSIILFLSVFPIFIQAQNDYDKELKDTIEWVRTIYSKYHSGGIDYYFSRDSLIVSYAMDGVFFDGLHIPLKDVKIKLLEDEIRFTCNNCDSISQNKCIHRHVIKMNNRGTSNYPAETEHSMYISDEFIAKGWNLIFCNTLKYISKRLNEDY